MSNPLLRDQISRHYPDRYEAIYGRVSPYQTLRKLQEAARREGIRCHNYMSRQELVMAINSKRDGFDVEPLVRAARERANAKWEWLTEEILARRSAGEMVTA